jgi:hypothetical protein
MEIERAASPVLGGSFTSDGIIEIAWVSMADRTSERWKHELQCDQQT